MDVKSPPLRHYVSTDKYWFSTVWQDTENFFFQGETKKSYGSNGRYWNDSLCLTREFMENERPSAIIDALDGLMDSAVADAIDHAIASGNLRESDVGGYRRKE